MAQIDPLILGALALLAITAVIRSAYRFGFVLLVMAAMLFVASIAAPMDWMGRPVRTWLTPIQTIRSYIFAGLGFVTYVTLTTHLSKLSLHRFSSQILILLLIGMYEGLIRVLTRDSAEGVLTFVLRLAVVLPAVWVLPAIFTQMRNALTMLRLIGLVAIAWIGVSFVQYIRDPSVLTLGGGGVRFQGMLANPQHAATLLAFAIIISASLALNDPKKSARVLWTGAAGLCLLLMLWTGSRTGLGMCLIGSVFVFYPKLRGSIIFLPIVAGVFFLGLQFVTGSGIDVEFSRLLSTENTRARSWMSLIRTASEHPLFGVGTTERYAAEGSENSFLYGIASFGLGMGALILTLMLVSAVVLLRLWRLRSWMSPLERRLTDLIVAINSMYFAGSLFEGYVLARVGSPLVILMIFAGMARGISARIQEEAPGESDHSQTGALHEEDGFEDEFLEWHDDEYEHTDPGDADQGTGPSMRDARRL